MVAPVPSSSNQFTMAMMQKVSGIKSTGPTGEFVYQTRSSMARSRTSTTNAKRLVCSISRIRRNLSDWYGLKTRVDFAKKKSK